MFLTNCVLRYFLQMICKNTNLSTRLPEDFSQHTFVRYQELNVRRHKCKMLRQRLLLFPFFVQPSILASWPLTPGMPQILDNVEDFLTSPVCNRTLARISLSIGRNLWFLIGEQIPRIGLYCSSLAWFDKRYNKRRQSNIPWEYSTSKVSIKEFRIFFARRLMSTLIFSSSTQEVRILLNAKRDKIL